MDQWDFKKWRKKLGINQVEAGEILGLSRGAVQYWESDLRPVPRAVELACQELLRRWKQRTEFGPVTLLYSDGPVYEVDSRPSGDLVLRCEPHPDNESALGRVVGAERNPEPVHAGLVVDDGLERMIWSGPRNCCTNAKSGKSGRSAGNKAIPKLAEALRARTFSSFLRLRSPCRL